jgi:regulator of protease activity HflC (stomatin/prohibitin superfamily)
MIGMDWILLGGLVLFVVLVVLILIAPSIHMIGPTEVGLVIKRFSFKKLKGDNPIAFNGEAGYQAELLMPGLRWRFWIVYRVEKFPWVQVPAGEIGVVIAQVGRPLPIGAKSALYKKEFGSFTDLKAFVENSGQKGVQRPVLSPGTLAPIHPVGFLVITKNKVYGVPIDPEYQQSAKKSWGLTPQTFGLETKQLEIFRVEPKITLENEEIQDMVGIVATFEGEPLDSGDIAGRLGGFSDIAELETKEVDDGTLIEVALGNKNQTHNNYQDYQSFLDAGGRIGLQHDPLLYGAYNLNPFLISVELVPMLVVKQGEVAVIKSYVGLGPRDTSGTEFKFGSLVRPGHRGIWQEPLRTGKYAINPRCYEAEIVPTAILTLNWSEAQSRAHMLDKELQPIVSKSREGFIFKIDLQVQIHVPDTKAPRVISIVGTMPNLVNEVLQAAVGNHFRDKIQSMPAIRFIETRQQVQEEAFSHIRQKLEEYEVETRGVYIQDVILPEQMVKVLTEREIANQEIETYKKQKEAQDQRIETEKAKGTADMQADLAKSQVGINIQNNKTTARKAEAEGESTYISQTGTAKAAEVRAVGMARAEAYKLQVDALGQQTTALVNILTAMAEKGTKIVPDILVTGGGGAVEGLAGALMKFLSPKK